MVFRQVVWGRRHHGSVLLRWKRLVALFRLVGVTHHWQRRFGVTKAVLGLSLVAKESHTTHPGRWIHALHLLRPSSLTFRMSVDQWQEKHNSLTSRKSRTKCGLFLFSFGTGTAGDAHSAPLLAGSIQPSTLIRLGNPSCPNWPKLRQNVQIESKRKQN